MYDLKHWLILEIVGKKKRSANSRNVDRLLKIKCRNCEVETVRIEPEVKLDQRCKSCQFLPKGEAGLKNLLKRYVFQAKQRKFNISLTLDEFRQITSSKCHYCGFNPSMLSKSHNQWGYYFYNGIDRKDNAVGYELDNCVSCCKICNWAKGKNSYNEFIVYLKRIVEFQKEARYVGI